jgi:hypothetical protein
MSFVVSWSSSSLVESSASTSIPSSTSSLIDIWNWREEFDWLSSIGDFDGFDERKRDSNVAKTKNKD